MGSETDTESERERRLPLGAVVWRSPHVRNASGRLVCWAAWAWAHSGDLVVGVFRVDDALTAERERANFCRLQLQWSNKAWHAGPMRTESLHDTEPETRDPRSVPSILDQHILLKKKREKDKHIKHVACKKRSRFAYSPSLLIMLNC